MDFFNNLAKFFGGLAGYKETASGQTIKDAGAPSEDAKLGVQEFTYRDNNGELRHGGFVIPSDSYGVGSENDRGIYGAILDDGTELNFKGTEDFLNSDKLRNFQVSDILEKKGDPTVLDKLYTTLWNLGTKGSEKKPAAHSTNYVPDQTEYSDFIKNIRKYGRF